MKPKHVAAERTNACASLEMMKIPVGADFFTLSRSQLEALITEAKRVRYQKPRGANGSTARYFHDMLQRRARAGKKS